MRDEIIATMLKITAKLIKTKRQENVRAQMTRAHMKMIESTIFSLIICFFFFFFFCQSF